LSWLKVTILLSLIFAIIIEEQKLFALSVATAGYASATEYLEEKLANWPGAKGNVG